MLTYADLRAMSEARVRDARVLYDAGRYDGAAYLVGYAVEYRLKGRIATSLLKAGTFPREPAEFERLNRIKTHRLDELLKLSGREPIILADLAVKRAWSQVNTNWSPETRYAPIGSTSAAKALATIEAVELLLRVL
jgi:HEPN domain-containing protein